jgi:asparagine synthase (glutamine-hydrolysing)
VNELKIRFRRTGESAGATLEGPASVSAGHLRLAWDGRIDNRDELGSILGCSAREIEALSDEALLLEAYPRLGVEALDYLVGDYAFALWDRRERALLCARDPLARRRLFYYASASTFVAGSSLATVLADPEVPRSPNEGVVAEYLLGSMASRDETLFAGVRRLIPGTWLRIDCSGERQGRIDWLDPHSEIRYARDEEYAEHLRALLGVAVRSRFRGADRIGVELSGGVDSSTVAGFARAELGDAARDRLLLLSLVFPGLACDERPFIEACRAAWRVPAQLVAADGYEATETADDGRYLDFPSYPNASMAYELRRRARAAGVRVILTGMGGDEWFSGSPYRVADDLRSGRLVEAIRQARFEGGSAPIRGTLRALASYGLRPCVPEAMKAIARPFRGAPAVQAPWIDRAFATRTELAGRLRVRPEPFEFPTLAQREIHRTAIHGWLIHAAEIETRAAAELNIDLRHPLADLRVARFALAIPESQRSSAGKPKRVLRAASAGLVPEVVRRRGTKAVFTPVFVQALEKQGGAAYFRHLGIAALGWVNAEPLERMYADMRTHYAAGEPRSDELAMTLWMIVGIERWARAAGFVTMPTEAVRATA